MNGRARGFGPRMGPPDALWEPGDLAPRAHQPFTHFLASLKERYVLLVDWHVGAGPRIPTGARRAMLDREGAESPQFHPIATGECSDDLVEDRIHDVLNVPLIAVRVVLGDALDEFGFDHKGVDPGASALISGKKP